MSESKSDLISRRIARADESFHMATIAIENKYWNTAASALYYTFFHLVQALFAMHEIEASTHAGLKTLFSLKFIKEGKMDAHWGKVLSQLFANRQEGDYGDFLILQEDDIIPLVTEVEQFRNVILQQLSTF